MKNSSVYELILLVATNASGECLPVSCTNVLYARYHITPARELQFGAVTLNSRKSRTFTIENLANKFEFKFKISATPTDQDVAPVAPAPPTKDDKKK